MRIIVVGLGVQGYKRKKNSEIDYLASVDPINQDADYKDIKDIPLDQFDAVLACIPDEPKETILRYALSNGKHVLLEKPLWTVENRGIIELQQLAQQNRVICYTAYNHRFEPHFIRMRELIKSGELGKIYSCRMFYGNGTARLVRDSEWRDKGAGVLTDIGSHLLDTCSFWFGSNLEEFQLNALHRHENKAPDHVIISSENNNPRIELEMTLCMWRNHFVCDVIAEKGSAHIESLCKWGPSSFTHRKRVLPSGRPTETSLTLVQEDPTWIAEYQHFKKLIEKNCETDLSNDIWLQSTLRKLSDESVENYQIL